MYYRKVKAYIEEFEMIREGDQVIAGVSGGGDSMAMLSCLRQYREEMDFSLKVVHVHHEIRGEEADRDAALVKQVCSDWQIPCQILRYDVPDLAKGWKVGTEEAGRRVRQEAFTLASKGCTAKVEHRNGTQSGRSCRDCCSQSVQRYRNQGTIGHASGIGSDHPTCTVS